MNARMNKRSKLRRRKRATLQKLSKSLSEDTSKGQIYFKVKVLGTHNKGKYLVCGIFLKWIACNVSPETTNVTFSETQLNPKTLPGLQL